MVCSKKTNFVSTSLKALAFKLVETYKDLKFLTSISNISILQMK